jgi:hypothetical protein
MTGRPGGDADGLRGGKAVAFVQRTDVAPGIQTSRRYRPRLDVYLPGADMFPDAFA